MTESDIQYALYCRLNAGNKFVVPNVCLYDWESDFLQVTKADYATEYEIKVSRADFKADSKKVEKHEILARDRPGERTFSYRSPIPIRRPTRFFYVVPAKMLCAVEVPDYAGLIEVTDPTSGWGMTELKPAPRLPHSVKLTDRQKRKLLTSTYYRFWTVWLDRHRNLSVDT